MWVLRTAVLLAVVTAAFCGGQSPATRNALELEKLETALLKWKKISLGITGYIVQQHQHHEKSKAPLLHFVNMASGSIQRVCPIAAVTVAPTTETPKSFPVKRIQKVEEMFAMLKKILQHNLCRIVKVVYSKDQAYPLIARLAGCKDPTMDAIAELGSILLTPKAPTSTPTALCTFAKQHLPKQSQKAVAFAQKFLRFGTVLPSVPKAKAAPVRASSPASALEAAKEAIINGLKPHRAEIARTVQALKAHASHAKLNKKTLKKLNPGVARKQPAHHAESAPAPRTEVAREAWVADERGFGNWDSNSESYSDESDSMSESVEPKDDVEHSTGTAQPPALGHNNTPHHHHHHHHSNRRLKRALFYAGCGLLGLGIVLVMWRSGMRTCRARSLQSTTKKVDALNYSALVEEAEDLESRPPTYVAHGVAAPVEV